MRVIERQMLSAIYERKNWSSGNTRVVSAYFINVTKPDTIIDRCSVYLHGNLIATVEADTVTVNDTGWQTATTKSRLHVILREFCGCSLSQTQRKWYITGYNNVALMEENTDYTFPRIKDEMAVF